MEKSQASPKAASKRVWRLAFVSLSCGLLSFFLTNAADWIAFGENFVSVLSLFAAAIFIRLMRPFPVTDPNAFESKEDIDILYRSMVRVNTQLVHALVAISLLILFLLVINFLVSVQIGVKVIDEYRGEAATSFIGLCLGYTAVRIYGAIRLDFSLLRRQSNAVEIAFQFKKDTAKMAEDAAIAERRKAQNQDFHFSDTAKFPKA
jgi:hypothetical protein